MAATAAAALSVCMVVVFAAHILLIGEVPRKEGLHRIICPAAAAAKEPDAGIRKGHLGTAPDTAADHRRDILFLQKVSQRFVSDGSGGADLAVFDLTVLYRIDLEILTLSEVLEDISVIVCNCNTHTSFLLFDFAISKI